jgi:CheY-like chemotaxis protein
LVMNKFVILCVDDEKIVLDSLKTQLKENFGNQYAYEMAQNAQEALELIEELNEFGQCIIVIVSDWLMPGTKGDEFLIEVHQKFPGIIKILLTGQADDEAVERAKKYANLHCCLRKPWNEELLINTIKAGLIKYG